MMESPLMKVQALCLSHGAPLTQQLRAFQLLCVSLIENVLMGLSASCYPKHARRRGSLYPKTQRLCCNVKKRTWTLEPQTLGVIYCSNDLGKTNFSFETVSVFKVGE